jgi:pimeloyl-ACP methyl ester carboxylesterase
MTPDPPLALVRRGRGRPLLLIHGSAADRTTWTLQLAPPPDGLVGAFTVLAYDRRGCTSAPLGPGELPTTEMHADHAAALLAREVGDQPALVCGSSYGAVVALELGLRSPARVAGLILCEPPLPPGPLCAAAPAGFGCAFDRLVATAGGERAGEMFLRAVLGDAAFEAIPPRYRRALCGTWRQIRADMTALTRYRLDPQRLATMRPPALLLTGDRSPAFYGESLALLARWLPSARTRVLPGAGHSMHIDAHRAFAREVISFAETATCAGYSRVPL